MDRFFSVGEAAKAANTTAETLRHYDRIGLVKPSKKDEWTRYRYYTEQDIVRLNTVRALQLMDLPLQEIKKVLEYDDLEKIIAFFQQFSKAKIQLAKADYVRNLELQRQSRSAFLKEYPQRVILLSDTLEMPTLENLWNYLNHFYEKLPTGLKEQFAFEDLAGIYTEGERTRLFAVCTRYAELEGLKTLPEGRYLCAHCTEETRTKALEELLRLAREEYGEEPSFTVQLIVVSGILQWNYEVQVYVGG